MKNKKVREITLIAICITIAFVAVIVGIVFEFKRPSERKEESTPSPMDEKDITLELNKDFGDDIYSVKNKKGFLPYSEEYRKNVDELLGELLMEEHEFEVPLIVYNPYGTNSLSVNVYFQTEQPVSISYKIMVRDEEIPDFSRNLYSGSDSFYITEHSYQIIGLVPGYKNQVAITATEEDGKKTTVYFSINMSKVMCESDTILENIVGESTVELTDGLFVVLGLDEGFNTNNYVYDNNGILRADLTINGYRSDRILFIDGKMCYSTDIDEISVINRLGRIEKVYKLDGYTMHHDYVYDKAHNSLLILANSVAEEASTIEDLIISLELTTGEVQEVVDMKDLLPKIYATAKMSESGINTYGGTGLDWIHLNSLDLVNDNGDIILSGREISTIIYVKNIYKKPAIKYMIADEAVYGNTIYNKFVLKKKGDFVNQAGQHAIMYKKDENLSDGQYFLLMYNNNYGASDTREDFPWEKYPGVGDFAEGTASKYYKYFIDENEKTYELVKSFDVAYSSIASSVQDVGENHVVASGKSDCYAEYDASGNLIRQWNYTTKEYAYRTFKYDFEGIWFQ